MDEAEIEGTALWAYRATGLDPDDPQIVELGRRLVGPVMRAHGMSLPGDAALGDGVIYVRPKVNGWRLRWGIAHEIGHWLLSQEGVQSEREEELADRVAASLLAPRPIAYRVARFYGPRFDAVATELRLHAHAEPLVGGNQLKRLLPRIVGLVGNHHALWRSLKEVLECALMQGIYRIAV